MNFSARDLVSVNEQPGQMMQRSSLSKNPFLAEFGGK